MEVGWVVVAGIERSVPGRHITRRTQPKPGTAPSPIRDPAQIPGDLHIILIELYLTANRDIVLTRSATSIE